MNWDAIGAIAELLGAVGVIASLVYLATQIRESREQMRAATHQQIFENLESIANRGAGNPTIDRALQRGQENFQQLDEEDAFRFHRWALAMMAAYENAHYQYRVGDRRRLHRSHLRHMFVSI